MPLAFPPAPPAFFSRKNDKGQEHIKNNGPSLRYYPLTTNGNSRGTVLVEPLMLVKPPPLMPVPPSMPPPILPPVPPHKIPPMQRHLPSPTPLSPMVTPSEHTPEAAAEQFRRMNSSLPDGVRYEPLDEETMKILRQKNPDFAKQYPAPPATPPATPASPAVPMTIPPMPAPAPASVQFFADETTQILKGLAQDERNASVFYGFLAENAPDKIKESFATLAKDSYARLEIYSALLPGFAPQETEINTSMEISQAISLALSEESKSLVKLGNLLELVADTPAEKQITRAVSKKIIGQQVLLSLK